MDNKKFVKLSDLVGSEFTIQEVGRYAFKKWDAEAKRMLTSDTFEQGYRKVYPVTTDKGLLDMGPGQLGNLLEAVLYNGEAKLAGRTFAVKSNGKTGMDIRYFFNPVKKTEIAEPVYDVGEEPVDLNDIPDFG